MKIIKSPKLSNELELLPFIIKDEKIYVRYYSSGVQAGFPSPADDFLERRLSLDERYMKKPEATFLVKVKGNSMYPTLHVGDILIVKSDIGLNDKDIAILSVNNTDFTVKRFNSVKKLLIADNKDFANIEVNDEDTIVCLGIVKHLIRDL